jgi:hypothetical protein
MTEDRIYKLVEEYFGGVPREEEGEEVFNSVVLLLNQVSVESFDEGWKEGRKSGMSDALLIASSSVEETINNPTKLPMKE